MAQAPQPPDLADLRHALGPAADTAAHLEALTGASAVRLRAATEHLDAAIAPGGRASEAAPPVAQHVIALLQQDLVPDAAARIELLYFLGQVTEAAEGEPEAPGVQGCRTALPAVLAVAEHCERDTDADVRTEAADTAEAAIEVMDRLGHD